MKDFENQYQAGQTSSSLRFREAAPVRRTEDFESAKVIEATETPPVQELKRTAEFTSETATEQKENQN